MTDSPTGACRAPGNRQWSRRHNSSPTEDRQTPPAPKIMRRTAPASRTSGRYAVGLRPILDPDTAGSTRPTAGRRRQEEDQSRHRRGWHGPAPSGM